MKRSARVPQITQKPYFFWESMVMLRKLAITAVIVFAGTYRWQLVLLLAIGVVALALVLQVTFRWVCTCGCASAGAAGDLQVGVHMRV